jgi:osmotically inducible protein OsmC
VVSASSSGAFELPVTLPSRIAEPEGRTSPEELLSAAHAACFCDVAGERVGEGGRVSRTAGRALHHHDGRGRGGWTQVVASELEVGGLVERLDEQTFARAAEAADAGCSFSTLLRASATVTVTAQLGPT